MVRLIEECLIAACAVRGDTLALLSSVPNVVLKAWTSIVRPRSSVSSIFHLPGATSTRRATPAAIRSPSRIRINPAGTSNTGVAAGSLGTVPDEAPQPASLQADDKIHT